MDKRPRSADDLLYLHLFVMLDCYCEGCGEIPEIAALWDTIPPGPSEEQAEEWSQRAADFLENNGWRIIKDMPYCPKCALKRTGQ